MPAIEAQLFFWRDAVQFVDRHLLFRLFMVLFFLPCLPPAMPIPSHEIFYRGPGPIIASAVHHGHSLRDELVELCALSEAERLREEDPFTAAWAQLANTQIVGLRTRFEVDLNRPREKAVYLNPDDAWGLNVWRQTPARHLIAESLNEYDMFYSDVKRLIQEMLSSHEYLVVYDLHTYNHRRAGIHGAAACSSENPEVNIGTGTMDRGFWSPLIDRFIGDLKTFDFSGRQLDVRENVKFQGGYFGQWLHEQFPNRVCAIAIEFKKFFMNEWTGEVDLEQLAAIFNALQSTVPGLEAELATL
jgi:N-formylglutamate deformylase